MFTVLLDEPGLFVFKSAADAAVPYRVEWVRPNRRSTLSGLVTSLEFGEYRFVAAGPADPNALIALLEEHSVFPNPPEAEAELKSLLERMRAV